jgi:hypothetical protein
VIGLTVNAWPAVQAENQFNDPPPAGHTMVMVRLRAKNISAGDPADFIASVRLVGSAGVGYSTGCGVIPDDFLFLQTQLFRGGLVEGNVCFEPLDTESAFVHYSDLGFDESNRRWFAVQ